ncbi:MAG TPA: hypothetical protein VK564_11160 [Thermodesulfobacteriota bacterium]|nr:hypothetical protein [Thermodesulfobacteriota bacterium]
MKLIESHYLNDGKLFNDGRPVDLIKIEQEEDFEALINNIITTGYYNDSYFDKQIDYREGKAKFDTFFLSSILAFLKPKSLLELGCGRGDVLFLLGLNPLINVRGVELSRDVLKKVWPLLRDKVDLGDIGEVCHKYSREKLSFNTFCAYDLWEHIPPRKLFDDIASLVALAERDALFFFTIPAFGEDKVFGELFPLEFEENREKFNARTPFDHLIVEAKEPPIPVKGHLICAHSEWWQEQFEAHGLKREEELEKNIHRFFDEHLFYARKSLYIFSLNTPEARQRVIGLMQKPLTFYRKWKLFVTQQEDIGRYLQGRETSFIDLNELKLTVNHAEFYMRLDLKERLQKWFGCSSEGDTIGLARRSWQFFINRLIDKSLNTYLGIIKKRHYLIP